MKYFSESVAKDTVEDAPIIYVYPHQIINDAGINRQIRNYEIDLNSDWDTLGRTKLNGITFPSFKDRLSGIPWEETKLFKRDAKRFGLDEAKRLADLHESMLDDIMTNGYSVKPNNRKLDEYITVLIGRYGDMFHFNGIHRLSCCMLSNKVQKIPVKVLARHVWWQRFRNRVSNIRNRRPKYLLYSQIPHPDLENIPYRYPTYERVRLISERSGYPGGTVLDAGAHWGSISYGLAQEGFHCTAVEINESTFKFTRRISKFPGKSFKPLLGNFLDIRQHFDTLVIFNIAHHFIGNDNFKRFMNFLNENSFKEIFYHTHREEGEKLKGKDINYPPIRYLNGIKDSSGLHNHEKIGHILHRDLFHIFQ